jgi:tRNA threonylcarbamoyladenosine biosynthesis protein TsaE
MRGSNEDWGCCVLNLKDPVKLLPILETQLWPTEASTRQFACKLAQRMLAEPALANVSIELEGDLGAGKTSLVRHLLQALGVEGRIKSPTYAVVEPHEGILHDKKLPIWHFDFYRFEDPSEWEDAGFRDVFSACGLKLSEWPQMAKGCLPLADLHIGIKLADDQTRIVALQANSLAGAGLLGSYAR